LQDSPQRLKPHCGGTAYGMAEESV